MNVLANLELPAEPVKLRRPPMRYHGAKWRIAPRIIPLSAP